MKFIETVLPWIALATGIVCLIACILWEKDRKWFWGILVGNIVILGMACFLPRGHALLLPQKYPSVATEQKGSVEKIWGQLVRGTNAPPESVSKAEPTPKKGGSWVWWKCFFTLLPFTFICGCFAFEEKLSEMLEERKKRKKAEPEPAKAGKTETKTPDPHSHFWKMDFWDIVSMVIEGVRIIRRR